MNLIVVWRLKANQATTYSKTEVDSKLVLRANQATTYTKTEVDNSSALKQHKLLLPSNEGSNGWGVLENSTNTVGRIVGAQPIRAFLEVDFDNPSSFNDVQIGLDMNLSGLNNYTKTGVDNSLASQQVRFLFGEKPATSASRFLDYNGQILGYTR